MIKRTLMAVGLGMALLGGIATTTHASSHVQAHPAYAAVHANLGSGGAEAQTAEADANVPCAIDATGAQTGNCQDSQNSAGGADSASTSGEGEGEATGPDGDNVQSNQ